MKNRIISLLIVTAFLLSFMPNIAFADSRLTDGTTKATLYYDYMELANGATATNYFEASDGGLSPAAQKVSQLPDKDTIRTGDIVVLGVRLSDFANLTGAAAHGLNSMTFSLKYNTSILTYIGDPVTKIDMETWVGSDDYNSIWSTDRRNAKYGTRGYYYLNTDGSHIYDDTHSTYPGEIQIAISPGSNSQDPQPYQGAEDQYLIMLPFEYKVDGTSIADGTKIFTPLDTDANGNAAGEYFNLSIPSLTAYQADDNSTDRDLRTLIQYDTKGVNIAPESFNVNYYHKESTDFTQETAFKTAKVPENATPAPTQIPANSEFSNPGKFLTGMKYTTNTAADTTNDSDFNPSNPPQITANTYVYGVWEQGHDITFDSNYAGGGVSLSPMPSETTKLVTVNPASTTTFASTDEPTVGTNGTEDFAVPDHYEFDGWYDAATGGNKIKFDGTQLVSSLSPGDKAYAHWNHKVTVEWYPTKADATAGTNKINSEEVDDSTLYTALTNVPADPTNLDDDTNHKYYSGWKNEADDTDVDFTGSGNVGTDHVFKVYQNWVDYYKVEFYDDEATGSPALIDTKYVNQRTDTTLPASDIPAGPTAKAPAGKGFGGWVYDASGTPTTFDQTVDVTTAQTSGVLKVYPEWKSQFDVKLYPNDGTTADGLGTPVTHTLLPSQTMGSNYTAPTRTNYILKEWNTQANGSGTSYPLATIASTTFSANTDLYAIWDIDPNVPSADRRTLTFDTVGGSTIAPIVVYKGDKIYQAQMPNNPTKTGPTTTDVYTFIDWFEAATLSNTTIVTRPITMDNDKTIYAHWSYTGANKVTITFNDNGADVKPVSPTTIDIAPGDSIGAAWPTNPEKTDKSFGGWYDGTTAKTSTDTFTTATTLVAKWNDRIKVVYDTNGGNADGPADVEQPATTNYADVTAVPTRTGYRFVGWYTKTNGSGHEIKAGTNPYDTNVTPATLTYGDLVTIPGATVSGTTVTLYARWAAVDPGAETGVPGGTSDPADNAVKVIFDDNVAATSTHTIIKSADPKYMYPQINKALSDVGGLPEAPTRNDYVFKSWNTRADGTGTTFTASDVISATTDSIVANGSKYELTLYAQWEVDPSYSNKVTLTFNKNIDGKGVAGDKYIEYKLAANDVLGFVPTKPSDAAKNDFKFEGWFVSSGPDANGKQQLSTTVTSPDKFDTTTPVAADVTYYAKWRMQLVAVVQPTTINGNPVYGDIYSGTAKHPLYKFYRIPVDKMGSSVTAADYISNVYDDGTGTGVDVLGHTDYKAEYTPQGGGTAATTMTDVGKYNIAVSMLDSSPLAISGVEIALTDPALYEILPAQWTVKVDPDTQVEAKTNSIVGPTIQVFDTDGVTPVASTRYEINYYKITGDVNGDNNIDPATDLGPAQTTVPTDIAKYVVSVKPIGTDATNYTIGKVDTTKTGTPAKVYSTTAAALTDPDPSYTSAGIGENIYYQIKANDPSADTLTADLTIQPAGTPLPAPTTQPATLKDNDFTTTKTFDNAETASGTDLEYYIIAPKNATEVKLTVTPKYDTTVVTGTYGADKTTATATGASAATITNGSTVGTVTQKILTVSLAGASPDKVVAVKMATPDGSVTKTYLVTVRINQSGIKLNYGNSPYGEIMKASNISAGDKQAAKDAFDVGNIYQSPYIPAAVLHKLKDASTTSSKLPTNIQNYPYRAWVDVPSLAAMTQQEKDDLKDPNINMDRNDYTIFIYNNKHFVDPGFTATDASGAPITNVTRTITVNRMNAMDISGIYDGNYTSQSITIPNQPSQYLVTEITQPYNQNDPNAFLIRPDKYTMTYSFTDPVTGETVTETRYVVVLQGKGDTDFSLNINLQDVNAVYQFYNRQSTYFKTAGSDHVITGTARLIYAFRCLDLDGSDNVNLQDVNPVYQSYNKYRVLSPAVQAQNNNPVEEWYNELPDSI